MTDAVACDGDSRDDAPRLPDGTLAGSALTMDRAVANVVVHARVPLVDAIRAAPADVIGERHRGRIAVGSRAARGGRACGYNVDRW